MKNYFKLFYLFLIPLLIGFSACNEDDDPKTEGEYTNGVLIVNEGLHEAGTGSISFIKKDSAKIYNDLFDKNNETPLAAIIQSVAVYNNTLFVMANSADKIEVLDANTFKQKQAPLAGADIIKPRYFAHIGSTGYFTCWGDYNATWGLDDSYIAVVDLNNMQVKKKIASDAGPEGIVVVDNKIFVANSFSNTVSVIINNEVVKKIEVIKGPQQLLVDKNNDIWVACNGGYVTNGGIVKLNPSSYEVEKTLTSSGLNPSGPIAINGAKDRLYFISGAAHLKNTSIYTLSITDNELPQNPFIQGSTFYGIGVDPSDGTIYVGDSPGFTTSGTVSRYRSSGEKIDEFTAGVAPNSFLFRSK